VGVGVRVNVAVGVGVLVTVAVGGSGEGVNVFVGVAGITTVGTGLHPNIKKNKNNPVISKQVVADHKRLFILLTSLLYNQYNQRLQEKVYTRHTPRS
jgi:hypothetical protein